MTGARRSISVAFPEVTETFFNGFRVVPSGLASTEAAGMPTIVTQNKAA